MNRRQSFEVPLTSEERDLLRGMAEMDLNVNSRTRHAAMIAAGLRCALMTIDLLEKPQRPAQRKTGGIKRDARDARFSKAIRQRDRFTCQRCGTVHAENSSGLHAMHMFSRRIQATRFDMENAAAGCYGCHQYLDSHPNEKLAFFRERLGDERFDALAARAHARRSRTNNLSSGDEL